MLLKIAACVVVLLAALATADPTLTVNSSVASACEPGSLAYYLVKIQLDKDNFDEFVTSCADPEGSFAWLNATVTTTAPKAVTGLASTADSVERRLATPSFPKCGDLYACPPGPCSVYDVGYQNGYNVDPTSATFALQTKGMCGPTFNVQSINRATNVLTPASVDSDTSEAFPSLYEDGVLIFDPATPGSPSLVPALGNLFNRNPQWYYRSTPAWESASNNPDNINWINCGSWHANKAPQHWPPSALHATTPEYGNFVDYAQNKGSFNDTRMKNVYPQTMPYANNRTDFVLKQLDYKNACDLSQCYWLPQARELQVGRHNTATAYTEMHQTVNCVLIEILRAQLPETWSESQRPASCFPDNGETSAFARPWDPAHNLFKDSNFQPFNVAFKLAISSEALPDQWYKAFKLEDCSPQNNADGTCLQDKPPFVCTSQAFKLTTLGSYILGSSKGGSTVRRIKRTTFYECFALNTPYTTTWESFQACLRDSFTTVSSHTNFNKDKYSPSKDYLAYIVFMAYTRFFETTWYDAGANDKINAADAATIQNIFKGINISFVMNDGLFAIDIGDSDSQAAAERNRPVTSSVSGTKKIQPMTNAVDGFPPSVPATFIMHNASILNDFQKSESAACNCNNEGIIYAWLDLPWFSDLPEAYTAASSPIVFPASDSAAYSATALRESAYSWASDAGGDFRDGLPIGLYVPSSRRYGRNFITYERNYLSLQETTTAGINSLDQTLANDYLFSPGSPNATVLQNELVFNVTAFQSQRHATRKLTYRYGSCMKPPYGQISSFELDAANFSKLYTNCTADLKSCIIEEESLMGYCDPVQAMLDEDRKLPYCFDDPLTYAQRQTLCTSKLAKHIVLARVLVTRSAEHVCNSDSKTCLVIPEEPVHALSTVLSSEKVYGNLDGYTILVAPFNWTMATMLTSGIRYAYPTSNKSDIATIDEDDTTWLGMESMAEEYFEALYDQSKGSAFVIEAVDSMCRVLNTSYDAKTNAYTIPYLRGVVPTITPKYVFPRHALAQVPVTYDNVALASATTTQPLRVQPAYSATNGDTPCTFVYVAGSNFSLAATNVDMTFCNPSTAGIDAAAVVFGGSNVSQARIHLDYAPNSANIRTPVIFAGDDTMHFPKSKTVNASMVRIAMAQPTADARLKGNAGQIDVYDIGAARAFGTVYVEMPKNPAVPAGTNTTIRTIEQLLVNTTLTWVPVTPGTNVSRLDVSQYTKVYGDNVLQLVFPESKAKKHGSTVIFACSLIGIVFVLGELTRAYLDKDRMAALEANATIGDNHIKDTAFGKEAENSKTGERILVRDFLTKGKTTNDEAESFRNLVDKEE